MSARTWAVLMAFGLLTAAAPAGAQDAKTRAEAKEVEKEAQAFYDKGEYAEALAKYERLDDIIPLKPAQKVRAARCVEQLGRLLEAQERFRAVAEDDQPTSVRADLDARESAKNALGALQRRIPKVIIQIEGADQLLKVDLELDGEPLQQSKVGTPLQLDPGEHTIKGSLQRGKELERETASARFDAKENTTLDVPLKFGAGAKKKQDLGGTGGGESQDYWAILKRKSSAQRTAGWVVVGVGGAVFLGGGATTLIALGVKSSLDEKCTPERQCPPSAHGDLDTYDTLQTVTTVLFIGGAVGVGTGIALLMTAPDSRGSGSNPRTTHRASAPSTNVTPWIGLGAAGVRGTF